MGILGHFRIASGNAAGKFAINTATGAVTVDAALDYETTTSYELVLNCAGSPFYRLQVIL